MADIIIPHGPVVGGVQLYKRFRDMGDGTHAEVVTTQSGDSGAGDVVRAEGSPVNGVQIFRRYRNMGDGTYAEVVSDAAA